jgi:hypothetical protein
MPQISGINEFLRRPFWRFAVMLDNRTQLPEGIDAHRAISVVTIQFVRKLVATFAEVTSVALVFEGSGRGDKLVERDFDLASMDVLDRMGRRVDVNRYFMEKRSMEAGLEVADLIAHTAGRQRRHQLGGRKGVVPDFKEMYWQSPIPPAFMSIDTVHLEAMLE